MPTYSNQEQDIVIDINNSRTERCQQVAVSVSNASNSFKRGNSFMQQQNIIPTQ